MKTKSGLGSDKRIAIIILVVGILLGGGLVVWKISSTSKTIIQQEAATQEPELAPPKALSPEAEKIRDQAIANPMAVTGFEGSKLYLHRPEDESFDINYLKSIEHFSIFVVTKTPNPQDFNEKRKRAEDYFVGELLKTDNLEAVCELDVEVLGYKYSENPSEGVVGTTSQPLSFCEGKL